jgi:uncharacterized protein YcgI (DUF1989 family)
MSDPALTLIPARHGKAAFVDAGQRIRVVNTHGSQVLDTWAFNRHDLREHMSMEHTRSFNSKIYAGAGDTMVTNRRRPILHWLEDSSPGRHDTLLCACNRYIYEELGCRAYHRNCSDNLHEALAALGLSAPETPSPLNLFMNIPVDADGSITRLPPASRPGDHVLLRAEVDLVLVFSACPQDITPINGPACTPLDAHFAII